MLALITGASAGIGEALAHEHAQAGGDVILVARREEKLVALKKNLEEKYGISAHVIVKDLVQPNAAQEIFDQVHARQFTVEYLINNAGFGGQGKFWEREWNQDLAMMNVNMMALAALTRFFLPEMVTRNSGRILNVASTAGLVLGGPLQTMYFATKHFVLAFSQGLAGELLDTNVTVTALCPGPIDTEFSQTAGLESTGMFDNAFSPTLVAREGYQAMRAGKLVKITGFSTTNRLLLKVAPLLPKKFMLRQIRQRQEVKS